jgi:seryl-tRNA synthetase
MKNLSLILRILAVAAGIGAVVVFFLINGKLAEKETELSIAYANGVALQQELEASQATAANFRSERDTARADADLTRRNLDNTRSELLAARGENSRTNDRLRESERELERTRQDLSAVRRDLITAQREVERVVSPEDFAKLKTERDTFETRVTEINSELIKAREEIRFARATPIVEAQAQAQEIAAPAPRNERIGRAAPATTGRFGASTSIASVDTKSGMLILSGGEDLEIKKGDSIRLISDLKAIATIQVTRVSDSETFANILPGSATRSLRTGMEVVILH